MTRCDQCGFVYDDVAVTTLADRVRSFGPRYREALLGSEVIVGGEDLARTRPAPATWSALEYACHVRDVLLVQRERAVAALVEDCPSFPRMHRDERVALAGYDVQRPVDVADELSMAASLLGLVFDRLDDSQWRRPLVYNFPEPAEHDVAWLGRHTVHEGEHHLGDIRAVLKGLDPTG